jgi:GTPase SAR1 family protein
MVMVVGEGNSGKSSLINALLGVTAAPTRVVPNTWKVDLYHCHSDSDGVWLYWSDRPAEPEKTTWARAEEVCTAQEAAAAQRLDGWRSDLFQARWFVRSSWPDRELLLVDTPGDDQLRNDIAIPAATLYRGEALELERISPADHYYYRADVVLWCLNATKLHSGESRSRLEEVAPQGKTVIGVLTWADEALEHVPESVLLDEARNVFGQWISDFVPVALDGGDTELQRASVARLRAFLDDNWLATVDEMKASAAESFAAAEVDEFVGQVATLTKTYDRALGNVEDYVVQIDEALDRIAEPVQAGVVQTWERAAESAGERAVAFVKRSDVREVGDLKRLLRDNAFDNVTIGNSIKEISDRFVEASERERTGLAARREWPTTTGSVLKATLQRPFHFAQASIRAPQLDLADDDFWRGLVLKSELLTSVFGSDVFGERLDNAINSAAQDNCNALLHEFDRLLDDTRQGLVDDLDSEFGQAYGEPPDAVLGRLERLARSCERLVAFDELPAAVDAALERLQIVGREVQTVLVNSFAWAARRTLVAALSQVCVETPSSEEVRVAREQAREALTTLQELASTGEQAATDVLVWFVSIKDSSQVKKPAEVIRAVGDDEAAANIYRAARLEADDELALLANHPGPALRHALESSLVSKPQTARITAALLASPDPSTVQKARGNLAEVHRLEEFHLAERLNQLDNVNETTEYAAWVRQRDETARAANAWLASTAQLSDILASERGRIQNALNRLPDAASRASALYADRQRANALAEASKKSWTTAYRLSFIGWGLAVLLLVALPPAGKGLSVVIWLASLVLWLVARHQRHELEEPDAWRKFYRPGLSLGVNTSTPAPWLGPAPSTPPQAQQAQREMAPSVLGPPATPPSSSPCPPSSDPIAPWVRDSQGNSVCRAHRLGSCAQCNSDYPRLRKTIDRCPQCGKSECRHRVGKDSFADPAFFRDGVPALCSLAGWYFDPSGRDMLRWWDGSRWLKYVADPRTGRLIGVQ